MNVKCLPAFLLVLAAPTALGDPPRVPVTWDPNDPDKRRTIISREEREQLGLTPRTWTGVVAPAVYPTLERLNETIDELKNTRTGDAIQTLFAMKFEGAVYVEVHLKHEPRGKVDSQANRSAIREAQRTILGNLTAAEFAVQQIFERSPGFVGYATKEALDKLATHPDVAGVCLDDHPLPEMGPSPICRDDLPPADPGEAADGLGVAERKVDPDVYRAFALTDRVYVSVYLRGKTSLPRPTDVLSEMWTRDRLREDAAKELQDRFLATVSAEEFWVWSRGRGGLGISGYVNQEGLAKLEQHPDVVRVGLRLRAHLAGTVRKP